MVKIINGYFWNTVYFHSCSGTYGYCDNAKHSAEYPQQTEFKCTYYSSIQKVPNVKVLGQWENWYVVDYQGTVGYSSSDYITV